MFYFTETFNVIRSLETETLIEISRFSKLNLREAFKLCLLLFISPPQFSIVTRGWDNDHQLTGQDIYWQTDRLSEAFKTKNGESWDKQLKHQPSTQQPNHQTGQEFDTTIEIWSLNLKLIVCVFNCK